MAILVTREMILEHDGKRIGGNSEHWIYLSNLKAYNEGYLLGVYLHFPFSDEDLKMAYKQILVGNEFIDGFGCSYEEYFISDSDAPFSIGEYDFPQALAEKYDSLIDYMSYPEEVVQYIADFDGKEVSITHLGGSENLSKNEKVGHSLVALGCYEVPNNLLTYIDYEKLGKDFLINSGGDVVGEYFIQIN